MCSPCSSAIANDPRTRLTQKIDSNRVMGVLLALVSVTFQFFYPFVHLYLAAKEILDRLEERVRSFQMGNVPHVRQFDQPGPRNCLGSFFRELRDVAKISP